MANYARFLPSDCPTPPPPRSSWWRWGRARIHVARAGDAAPRRLIVVHGAGGHSGTLWPLAGQFVGRDFDVAAPDLPLYGRSSAGRMRYPDWVELLSELIVREDDGRPAIVLGASIGGLLAVEAAARAGRVAGVAATCLLQPGRWRARWAMARFGLPGLLGGAAAGLPLGPIADVRVPVKWVAPLSRMSASAELNRLCAGDPLGGGARVPLGFFTSFLGHRPRLDGAPPVLLAHPARDRWTPLALSLDTFNQLPRPHSVVALVGCEHLPMADPGVRQLVDAVCAFADDVTGQANGK
ncbi:alpha/beta hydrolase [Tessaracoccus sp. OH4464_COT-324]|uniref:alpha/beta hydrolase n=1 Tax=Tessaracoccus sp. OH4464_COT-324 TaxID=2491059 RepID=UPI000F62D0DE|nr:alpha/beta fold hydrolase [Tessaracoccus sp. OH4464_COT-324]RRD45826.1 alpha/beta fold hydrolase [Tessaracoccus sp. OH4464_COT-324]